MQLDTSLFRLINNLSHKISLFDWLMIFVAQYSGYFLVVFAVVLFFLLRKDWRRQTYYFSVVALSLIVSSGIITTTLRFFFYRPRPYIALSLEPLFMKTSSAFPSGHAVFFFTLAAAVLFFNRKMGVWFLAIAALMGFARIFSGVHYPLDILGGAAIGVLSVFFVVFLLEPKKFKERVRSLSF